MEFKVKGTITGKNQYQTSIHPVASPTAEETAAAASYEEYVAKLPKKTISTLQINSESSHQSYNVPSELFDAVKVGQEIEITLTVK